MKFKQISKVLKKLKKKSSRFFTIIEVLVVISIIGIISGLVIINQESTRALARDKKRIADLAAYQGALQEYYSQHKEYPINSGPNACIAHQAGCLKVLENEDFLTPLPKDPLSQDPDYHYLYGENATVDGKEYRLAVRLERDTRAMARDGGSDVALYEVFSTLGSHIAISYTGRGITKMLSCDVMTIDQCNFQGGVNVLRLAGRTASVDFTGGAHAQLATKDFYGTYYRKPHTISNSTSTPLSDYQVRIKVHRAIGSDSGEDVYVDDKCQADFRDIRFYASDEVTELPYWLEKIEGNIATFWLKVDSIPASGSTTIYISYGKEKSTTSNPDNLFGYTTDTTYTYLKYISPTFNWENRVSVVDLANGDDICSANRALAFDAKFWGTPTTSFSVSSNGVTFLNPTVCNSSWSNSLSTFITWKAIGFWDDMRTDVAGGVVANPGVYFDSFANKARITFETTRFGASADSVKFQIILQPTGNVIFSINNTTNLTDFSPTVAISRGNSTDYIDFSGDIATNKTWIFYLRKYVSPEPSHGAWGSEKELTYPLNYKYCICCFGPPDIGADCTAQNNVPFLNLSSENNAHAQEPFDLLTDWRYRRVIDIDNTMEEGEVFPPSMAGWGYRKKHVINPAVGAGTNYPIKITVYYGSGVDSGENVYLNEHSRTDFGDIRFTDDDGETILDYSMAEMVDSSYAVFWVEVRDDLSVNPQSIFLYYDNPSQTYNGNPDNVFSGYTGPNTYSYAKHWAPFYWEDRVSTVDLANSDDVCSANQALAFNARVWGTDTNSFSVSSNGVTFLNPTACSSSWSNSLSTFITWKAIGFWDDMRTDVAGGAVTNPGVYFDSFANKARITFETTRYGASADSVKFQTILQPTGNVIFSIDNTTNLTNFSPTVAISRGNSADYIDITSEIATNKTWIFYLRRYVSPEPSHGVWEGVKESRELVNYSILISIDTSELISQGKMQGPPNCGADIRVVDSDGITNLNYYIEPATCNTNNTRIWVRVPLIPANSVKTIYVYYGNSSALDMSDLESVCPGGIQQDPENGEWYCYDFFDDFEGASLDETNRWQVTNYKPDPTNPLHCDTTKPPEQTCKCEPYYELTDFDIDGDGETESTLHIHVYSEDLWLTPPYWTAGGCGYSFNTKYQIDAKPFKVSVKGRYDSEDPLFNQPGHLAEGSVLTPYIRDVKADFWGLNYSLFRINYEGFRMYRAIDGSSTYYENIPDTLPGNENFNYIKLGENVSLQSTGTHNHSYSGQVGSLDMPFAFWLFTTAGATDAYSQTQKTQYDVYWDSVSIRSYTDSTPEIMLKREERMMTSGTYACLSASPARDITCTYRTLNCNADETTVCSLSFYMNAHVGSRDKYDYKVCCKTSL